MLAWLSTIYFTKDSELCTSLFSTDIKHPHLAEILTEMSDFKWCSIALFPVESCTFWLKQTLQCFSSQTCCHKPLPCAKSTSERVNQLCDENYRVSYKLLNNKNLPFEDLHKTLRSAATEGGHLHDSVHKPSNTHCADNIPSFSWYKELCQVTLVTLIWATTERYRQIETQRERAEPIYGFSTESFTDTNS